MADSVFYAESVEEDAAGKDEGDAEESPEGESFTEEEPGNHGGDEKAHAAPGGVGKSEVQGEGSFGKDVETESVGYKASGGREEEGEALRHFQKGGSCQFKGDGQEK